MFWKDITKWYLHYLDVANPLIRSDKDALLFEQHFAKLNGSSSSTTSCLGREENLDLNKRHFYNHYDTQSETLFLFYDVSETAVQLIVSVKYLLILFWRKNIRTYL